ncbi:ribosomal protein S18 acetylase RimI-like enzyme [Chitinivorax tropicus]|uniref:Ribosomal protein S18 acetylase RimI-like enzyme n=1 Tax=Chitinivorax tropicus TaxID=714531 RepID=A0A840MS60_9PROT|nr:GNAT family N-acetyltransferase [Chitinivorax tropicus]MBB5018051.1 ribosomal protein S18 acetylase RimI-like enzyme [Chitinivorax tropicus]
MQIRPYHPADWPALCEVHDPARMLELAASGLADAFLPLEQAGPTEGLFDGTVLVAEWQQQVVGFVGFTDDELTWLYVHPSHQRKGIARGLIRAAVAASVGPLALDVLVGNEAALALYLSEGFHHVATISGKLAGNEQFPASAHVLSNGTPAPLDAA